MFQIGNYFKLFENDYTSIIKGVSLFGDIGFSINALMSDYKYADASTAALSVSAASK